MMKYLKLEWKIWAKENVVSVLIDFPRSDNLPKKKENELQEFKYYSLSNHSSFKQR